jgi:hypothetical protein
VCPLDFKAAAADILFRLFDEDFYIIGVGVSRLVCRLAVYTHHAGTNEALGLFTAFGMSLLDEQLVESDFSHDD